MTIKNTKLMDRLNKFINTKYIEEATHIIKELIYNSLKDISTIDNLTKLQNRLSFNQEMKMLIPLALREKMKIGVLLINIDRFRAVNDEHGDDFGDKFLKLYANTIKDTIRTSDIAVRFGGGEFLVLLVNIDTEDRTIELATKLKDKLANRYLKSPNGDQFKKTVCIGISMFPEDSTDINEIIKNSEMALSDARDIGRSQVLRYSSIQEDRIDFF